MFEPIRTLKMLASDSRKTIKLPESIYEGGRKQALRVLAKGDAFIAFGQDGLTATNEDMPVYENAVEYLKIPSDCTHVSVASNFSNPTSVYITFGYIY